MFIEKAIKSDTEFLTKGNIMDYSLLLGVDEAKKELTVGIVGKRFYYNLLFFCGSTARWGYLKSFFPLYWTIVTDTRYYVKKKDFIGAYTWYKKVESRSKSTLNPNKEVTVVPPDQYKWRFYRIIDDYFVAVSGKEKKGYIIRY